MGFNFGSFGVSALFGGNSYNSLYSSLGDYNSIRSGSYKKLLKAYYATTKGTGTAARPSSRTDKWSNNALADQNMVTTKEKADKLSVSASALTAKGNKAVFEKKYMTVTDAQTGEKKTQKDYDRNAINNAIKGFVSDYNSAVQNAFSSTNAGVVNNARYMVQQTSIYKESLAGVGISINADNTLKIDMDKLNAADVDALRRVFNDSHSFAAQTASQARMISQAAGRATSSGLYGQSGGYMGYAGNYFNWYM